tara:strand:- start:686 stop:1297 length:612 start_codon:yes stop_codon:yes gene_type:complete
MANSDTSFILSTKTAGGSTLTQLTSGAGAGKIKYIITGGISSANKLGAAGEGGVTGIVIPLHGATITSFPDSDGASLSHAPKNILGDPAVADYSLTSGDFLSDAGAEVNGGAQKFVNAVLDSAFRGYTSGVDQSSGINSMTVTRGDLSLSNTSITDGTGIVNTYTRSYTVNFKYYQSGVIQNGNNDTAARPDIANDGSDGVPF